MVETPGGFGGPSAPDGRATISGIQDIMENKSADLTNVKLKNFVGVVCKDDLIYVLGFDGILYVLNSERKTKKWMNIKVDKCYGCNLSEDLIVCNCGEGIVRVF